MSQQSQQDRVCFQHIVERVSRGVATDNDAAWLSNYVETLEANVATLIAILEDALVFECGVTFSEESPRAFDGAGTA